MGAEIPVARRWAQPRGHRGRIKDVASVPLLDHESTSVSTSVSPATLLSSRSLACDLETLPHEAGEWLRSGAVGVMPCAGERDDLHPRQLAAG